MAQHPPVKVPRVGRTARRAPVAPIALALILLGSGVFAKLADERGDREEQLAMLPPLASTAMSAPAATPAPPAAATPPVIRNSPVLLTATPAAATFGPAMPLPPLALASGAPVERAAAGMSSAILIVDLAQRAGGSGSSAQVPVNDGDPPQVATVTSPDPTGDAIAAAGGPGGVVAAISGNPIDPGLSGDERFRARVGDKDTEVSRARRMADLDRLVPQGAIIAATLETALNTDLPGFARAIVSRDVLSFDGSAVMIHAGSRLIGEYNSGVAQGASRIFIIWTRLIRPDGVSITLASPAVDDLGRGGLSGKVNRHFFRRFGSAILMSALTGGISALSNSVGRGQTVVVSNVGQASALGNLASQSTDIPPTITTKPGANVRVFVARDLDFSAVGPGG